jgi:hypothetical protein
MAPIKLGSYNFVTKQYSYIMSSRYLHTAIKSEKFLLQAANFTAIRHAIQSCEGEMKEERLQNFGREIREKF